MFCRDSTTILNGVIRKNNFDLLTLSDLDLGSRSLKIYLIGPGIMSNRFIKFHEDLISSF